MSGTHASDCAVHNEPAYPNGPCNCGATAELKCDLCGCIRQAEGFA